LPRIIDHQDRRQQVIQIARRLSLVSGLEGMTVRAIAKETGFSTAIVSYYFKDKSELAVLVFKDALEISEARFMAVMDEGGSLSDCVKTLLPVDDEMRDVWRTWIAFWGLTVSDAMFRAVQVEKTEVLISRLSHLLEKAGHENQTDLDSVARRMFAAILGISVQAVHDPARWDQSRQFEIIDNEMKAITAAVNHP
jgi:TetR/AcrR family transcriptional repressor of bet genes